MLELAHQYKAQSSFMLAADNERPSMLDITVPRRCSTKLCHVYAYTCDFDGFGNIKQVQHGEEGRLAFEKRIREIFGLTNDVSVSLSYLSLKKLALDWSKAHISPFRE